MTKCAIQFSGDPNSGLFSGFADSLSLVCGGGARFSLETTFCQITPQIRAASGTILASIYSFSSDADTGLLNPSDNILGVSCENSSVAQFGTGAITLAQNIFLPTTGGTPCGLSYCEKTTFASAFTYENTTIASITISIIRIGMQTTLYVPISVTQTNANGSASVITINTIFPTRVKPNAQITSPFYLNNGGTIGIHSITLFTDGNITIAQNSEAGFANNTSVVFVANALSWIN